jgi:hypothetical protein
MVFEAHVEEVDEFLLYVDILMERLFSFPAINSFSIEGTCERNEKHI